MNRIIYNEKTFFGEVTTEIIADGYGFVMVTVMDSNKEVGLIHDLCVHKTRRGEGLGRVLLEDACKIAGEMGAKVARLSVKSGSWLEEWYKRHGFVGSEKIKEIANHVLMEKPCEK